MIKLLTDYDLVRIKPYSGPVKVLTQYKYHVINGNHRCHVLDELFGEEYSVEIEVVDMKDYSVEQEYRTTKLQMKLGK